MRLRSPQWLAAGAVMSILGAVGIAWALVGDVPWDGPLAFGLGFLVGVTAGLGATIAVWNLAGPRH
jgi:hypothetical protein